MTHPYSNDGLVRLGKFYNHPDSDYILFFMKNLVFCIFILDFFLESTFALWIKNTDGKGIYLTTYKSNQPEVCQSVSTLCLRTIIIYFVLLETSAIQNNSENGNIGREVLQYRHRTFLGKRCALATLYVKMQVKGTHDK